MKQEALENAGRCQRSFQNKNRPRKRDEALCESTRMAQLAQICDNIMLVKCEM